MNKLELEKLLKKNSIGNELMVKILLICVIAFLIGGSYMKILVAKAEYERFSENCREIISKIDIKLNEGRIKQAAHAVDLLSKDRGVVQLTREIGARRAGAADLDALVKCAHLANYIKIYNDVDGFILATEKGGFLEYPRSGQAETYDPRRMPWYRQALAKPNETCVSDPFALRPDGRLVVGVAHAIQCRGRPLGVFISGWDLADINREIMALQPKLSENIVILNQNGKVICSPRRPEWVMKDRGEIDPRAMIQFDGSMNMQRIWLRDEWKTVFASQSGKTGWRIIAVIDQARLAEKVDEVIMPLLFICLGMFLVIAGAGFYLVKKQVAEPIGKLTAGAAVIAGGELHTKVELKQKNELGVLAATLNDMNERLSDNFRRMKEQNRLLGERKEELKTLLEHARDIILRVDERGNVRYINPVIERYIPSGAKKWSGKKLENLALPDKFVAAVKETLEKRGAGRGDPVDFELALPDGKMSYWQASVVYEPRRGEDAPGVLSVIRDVTGQKELEQRIARLDCLGVVGEMAAGIGHEVRNPMTTVRGFLQMMVGKEAEFQKAATLKLMIEELDRANGIIAEFLSLARNETVHFGRYNLNDIIRSMEPLLRIDAEMAGKRVALDLGEAGPLTLDKKEIRQLLINLARNGLEAMPEQGELTIRTYREEAAVVLAVIDHGCGIPREIMDHIGVPFQTTKENGTGLGLAVCYGIAGRHGARIRVETGVGGTTFEVCFPV